MTWRLSVPFQDRVDHWDLPDDAVVEKVEYTGGSVSWTAAMEPIVNQGGSAVLYYSRPTGPFTGAERLMALPSFVTGRPADTDSKI